jgi:nitrite reductase/ring-hydroxylating ferredoxin subunit
VTAHVVARAGELPPGARKTVTIKDPPIVVFNVGGEYFAVLNVCPHQGASLAEGTLGGLVESSEPGQYRYSRAGEILRCPWHNWEFDLRTGKSWCRPSRIRVKDFPVAVKPGQTLVEGPYVAETFAVRVDDSYVVIDL